MKIALLGYGRMGKIIEKKAAERGHTILLKVDITNRKQVSDAQLKACDIAIDFSTAEVVIDNYNWCFDLGIPVVSGTTGWLEKWDDVVNVCRKKEGSFFYASNFSIGVNIFFQLNRVLAGMMNNVKEYNVLLEETHHIHKLDAPSGTAITLAENLLENLGRYNAWELTDGKQMKENILPVSAIREGEVPGIHKIIYSSEIDKIEICHSAFSRDGFALGAVLAAEFMEGKTGVHGMDELMKELFR